MPYEREWRDLNTIDRWSIVRVNRKQNVAEHSYFVVLYAMQTADLIEWSADLPGLIRYALCHDAPELELGDVPGWTKMHMNVTEETEAEIMRQKFPNQAWWFSNLTNGIKEIVKFADVMEVIMYICEEVETGNKSLTPRETWMGDLYNNMWSDPRYSMPDMPIFYRNMHRLHKAWYDLPVMPRLSKHREEQWRGSILPAINIALNSHSGRVY